MKGRIRRIHYKVYGLTDVGRVRENNEDNFIIRKELGFFAVADGMGGHEGGEVASKTAIDEGEKVVRDIFSSPAEEDTWSENEVSLSNEEKMKEIIQKSNVAIHSRNVELQKQRGETKPKNPMEEMLQKRAKMGTTFVCAKILGQKLYIANTGDSRCYLIRGGSMQKLTEDHSIVEEMIQAGKLKEKKEASARKIRDYITGCLGTNLDVETDVVTSIPRKGDVYLLCSDGLTKMLSDEKISHITNSEKDIKKGCHLLVNLANELGGRDNITVVMVQITGVGTSASIKFTKDHKETVEHEDTLQDF